MPRIRPLTPEQMAEYHNTAYLLRPINTRVVEEYAQAMKDGAEFPPIILGTTPDEDGEPIKLIVDGNHIYRACQVAEMSHKCEYISYPTLADALADQLKRNSYHGVRLTRMQRDKRIKQLIEEFNWSVRQVAHACGVSSATVSRVNRDMQGAEAKRRPARQATGPRVLQPRAFINTIENLFVTLEDQTARAQTLAAIYDPDRDAAEVQRLVQHLRTVAEELAQLVRGPSPVRPTAPAARAPRQREATAA